VEIRKNTKLGNNIREKLGVASVRKNMIIYFFKLLDHVKNKLIEAPVKATSS